jgi:antitoxin component of MazEF toxin-antitoxin module
MKISKKITIVGNSIGIVIDKPLAKKLKIKQGDYVEIDIKKI